MAPVVTPERRWLDEHTDSWVGAGLITPDAANAIREFEQSATGERPERFGLVAEVVAYLGCVLALMGGAVVVGSRWDELGLVARLGLAVAIALIGLAGGAWLVSFGESGTSRLGGLLRVVGTAGVGGATAIVLHELDVRDDVAAIQVGVVAAALSLALWRNLDRPLQLIAAGVGAGIALGGFANLADLEIWWIGFPVWVAGAAVFVAAAAERLRPRTTGLLVGYVTAMIGGAAFSDLDERFAPVVMGVTAGLAVLAALRSHERLLLVAGVIGFLMAVQALLQTTFTSVASAGIVSLVGLAVVSVVVARARRA